MHLTVLVFCANQEHALAPWDIKAWDEDVQKNFFGKTDYHGSVWPFPPKEKDLVGYGRSSGPVYENQLPTDMYKHLLRVFTEGICIALFDSKG